MPTLARNDEPLNPASKALDLSDLRRAFNTPVDYVLPPKSSIPDTGETRLCRALLADAVCILLSGKVGKAGEHLIGETICWITRGDVGLLPFDMVCVCVGLEPDLVRRAVLTHRRAA